MTLLSLEQVFSTILYGHWFVYNIICIKYFKVYEYIFYRVESNRNVRRNIIVIVCLNIYIIIFLIYFDNISWIQKIVTLCVFKIILKI